MRCRKGDPRRGSPFSALRSPRGEVSFAAEVALERKKGYTNPEGNRSPEKKGPTAVSRKEELRRLPAQLERKNPLVRTARLAVSLMKNQIITSLILLFQGLLFFFLPSGDLTGLVQMVAVALLVAAVVNILIHWFSKHRTNTDIYLIGVNMALAAFAVYCLVLPEQIEPIVRQVLAVVTVVTNGINLVSVLKLENKKTWRFVVGLCASIAWLVLGVAMFFAPEQVIANIQHSIGLLLVLNAVTNIWYIVRMREAAVRPGRSRSPGAPAPETHPE